VVWPATLYLQKLNSGVIWNWYSSVFCRNVEGDLEYVRLSVSGYGLMDAYYIFGRGGKKLLGDHALVSSGLYSVYVYVASVVVFWR